MRLLACALLLGAGAVTTVSSRAIEYADLTPATREILRSAGVGAEGFDTWVRGLAARTEQRQRSGAHEHLVYFILQSTRFTATPPIEPAVSAAEFARALPAVERQRWLKDDGYRPPMERLPAAVEGRFRAFLAARPDPSGDERLAYFARMTSRDAPGPVLPFLYASYVEAMRFLYRKEFPEEAGGGPVAALYQQRGLSTDSAFEANYAVDFALRLLKDAAPSERLQRILIIGPGLDVAPRTDLVERFPPQSYQPFGVADSVLRAGFADRSVLRVHSIDVDPGVISYLEDVSAGRITRLYVATELTDRAGRRLTDEYRRYFDVFGGRIGKRAGSMIEIDREVAERLTAERLDIVTRRLVQAGRYDLVVATNVFAYFSDAELALALTNVAGALREGGYLVHNDDRASLPLIAAAAQLAALQMRTLLIANAPRGALYEAIWIHRRAPAAPR